jgi:Uma2 family endonuclease
MTAMANAPVEPQPLMPLGREWTVDDLDRLPDDGLQYELLDGMLLVTPAPIPVHQRAIRKLTRAIEDACPASMEVFISPLDWRPDLSTSLQPDLLVVHNEDVGPKNITAPLVLAVEVLSPSTRGKDLLLKRVKFEEKGVENYWIVDPKEPSITALQLTAGRYERVATAAGDEVAELTSPFPLRVVPAELIVR